MQIEIGYEEDVFEEDVDDVEEFFLDGMNGFLNDLFFVIEMWFVLRDFSVCILKFFI